MINFVVIMIGAGVDYVAVSAVLEFTRGSMRECHTVQLIQDDECELPVENFFANLTLLSGRPVIIIDPFITEVIIDDSSENDCGESNPCNYTNHV